MNKIIKKLLICLFCFTLTLSCSILCYADPPGARRGEAEDGGRKSSDPGSDTTPKKDKDKKTDSKSYTGPVTSDKDFDAYAKKNYSTNGKWVFDGARWKWMYVSSVAGNLHNTWAYLHNPYCQNPDLSYSWFNFDENGFMREGLYIDKAGQIFYLDPVYGEFGKGTWGSLLTGDVEINGVHYTISEMTKEILDKSDHELNTTLNALHLALGY